MSKYTTKDIERFWSKVAITNNPNDCWEWQASRQPKRGYGYFGHDKKIKRAHRVSWEIMNGEIPIGMEICHSCDNTSCVNPNHLFLGSHTDNMHDMIAKGRDRIVPQPGESHGGHKLTKDEVLEIRSKYEQHNISQWQLAKQYGVCQTQIGRIVRYQRWKHI